MTDWLSLCRSVAEVSLQSHEIACLSFCYLFPNSCVRMIRFLLPLSRHGISYVPSPVHFTCSIPLSCPPNLLIVYMCMIRLSGNYGQQLMDMLATSGFTGGVAVGAVMPSNMRLRTALLGNGCLGVAIGCSTYAMSTALSTLWRKSKQ